MMIDNDEEVYYVSDVRAVVLARNGRSVDNFPPEVAISHTKAHPLVLTHNDLFPRNIMVSGTNVTAILDWECAGWFPSHWEYCKCVNWGKA
ncbi:hypothetical protein BD410DRAFT_363616 [Rickenella mellea]|uniref:Aminoglycoside phosphotransferase domain-containing protein n=1 Tax=Rickenella mellea TaxID=50990 RepID=A0A4Y7Q0K9_9AGAM|nr:hypothetical protein BD410DRAFT_363616 [Rickenella mellea]